MSESATLIPSPTSTNVAASPPVRQSWRFGLLGAGLVSLTCLVLVRLISVQIFPPIQEGPSALEEQKLIPRGVIVDRNGNLLAADRFFFQVTASPDRFEDDAQRRQVAEQLKLLLDVPAEETFAKLQEFADKQWVKLAENIPYEKGQKLRVLQKQHEDTYDENFLLRHVQLESTPQRYYPQEHLASHILGFVNLNRESQYGLERYYDRFLLAEGNTSSGAAKVSPLESLPTTLRQFLPSVSSHDLILTLDRGIQFILEEEIALSVNHYRAQGGTIIVLEPKTGAILGMASYPNYDPNHYSDFRPDEFGRFLDPAISLHYEPGSIFKIITMGAGLNTEVVTPTMMFMDDGEIIIGQRTILNSDLLGHGYISLQDALAYSLNVVTAQVAEKLGTERFYQYIQRFGFSTPTEVDLAGEVAGQVKFPGNELWSESDLGTNSFGQGIAVTPLQMANAAAAIANGGKLMRPYIVASRAYNGQVVETQPTIVRTVLTPEHAKELTEMMVYTVDLVNKAAIVEGYQIAGKSGTAQVAGDEGYFEDQINTSFIGFAPADDPKFVMLVKLERPDYRLTQWADENAVPTFGRVARRLFIHMNIPPDAIRLGKK